MESKETIWYWISADSHVGEKKSQIHLKRAVEDINKLNITSKAIFLGDMVWNDSKYIDEFEKEMNTLQHDWTYILGNHDFRKKSLKDKLKSFFKNINYAVKKPNYFTKNVKGVQLVALSPEFPHRSTKTSKGQRIYLKKALENSKEIPTIIFSHIPPVNSFDNSTIDFFETWLSKEVSNYNVKLWISAHNHEWKINKDVNNMNFDEIIINSLIDKYGNHRGDESLFLGLSHNNIKLKFRNHKEKDWIEVNDSNLYVKKF